MFMRWVLKSRIKYIFGRDSQVVHMRLAEPIGHPIRGQQGGRCRTRQADYIVLRIFDSKIHFTLHYAITAD
jgi:hypothetical protein